MKQPKLASTTHSHKIKKSNIFRALEGDLNPVDCSEVNNSDSSCSNSDLCVTKYVWKRISDSINDAVDGIMLSELVEESKRVQAEVGTIEAGKSKQTCGK